MAMIDRLNHIEKLQIDVQQMNVMMLDLSS